MSKKMKSTDDQGRAFIEAARALEADESEENFNAALAKIARHKPPAYPPKEPKVNKEKPAK